MTLARWKFSSRNTLYFKFSVCPLFSPPLLIDRQSDKSAAACTTAPVPERTSVATQRLLPFERPVSIVVTVGTPPLEYSSSELPKIATFKIIFPRAIQCLPRQVPDQAAAARAKAERRAIRDEGGGFSLVRNGSSPFSSSQSPPPDILSRSYSALSLEVGLPTAIIVVVVVVVVVVVQCCSSTRRKTHRAEMARNAPIQKSAALFDIFNIDPPIFKLEVNRWYATPTQARHPTLVT